MPPVNLLALTVGRHEQHSSSAGDKCRRQWVLRAGRSEATGESTKVLTTELHSTSALGGRAETKGYSLVRRLKTCTRKVTIHLPPRSKKAAMLKGGTSRNEERPSGLEMLATEQRSIKQASAALDGLVQYNIPPHAQTFRAPDNGLTGNQSKHNLCCVSKPSTCRTRLAKLTSLQVHRLFRRADGS